MVVGDQDPHGLHLPRPSRHRYCYRHAAAEPLCRFPAATRSAKSPPTSSARSRMPPIPSPRPVWSKVKPRPSSATLSATAVALAAQGRPARARRPSGGPRSRAPPGRRGRRRAGRPAGSVAELALGLEARPRPRPGGRARARGRRAPPRGRGRRAPSGAAGARASSSSCIAWLASARISASSPASSGGAFSRAASRRSSKPVSDWLTSSWRSRATRARSSSWAVERRARGAPSLGLEPLEHADERLVQARDLLGPPRVGAGAQVGAGAREVGALHLVDELLQRLEAPLDQEHVEEDRERDREPEHERRPAGVWTGPRPGWRRSPR